MTTQISALRQCQSAIRRLEVDSFNRLRAVQKKSAVGGALGKISEVNQLGFEAGQDFRADPENLAGAVDSWIADLDTIVRRWIEDADAFEANMRKLDVLHGLRAAGS
jgi:hypothetical protein